MIVDSILETGIACDVGARLPLQHDGPAVRHDQTCPDQQNTRLTERNLAVIDTDQTCPLRYKKETPARTVIDVLRHLSRNLSGQIGADAGDERRRYDVASLHHIRSRW